MGKIASIALRSVSSESLEIAYLSGLWTRKIGPYFLPDGLRFEYTSSSLESWKTQIERYQADANEYWLRYYKPNEGDVIVDVGAGRGEDALAFSKGVGVVGRVFAIEAHPLSFAILQNFCKLNHLLNVTPLHLALMDESGVVRIEESESSWMENAVHTGSMTGMVVAADTLANVCKTQGISKISFLKMNIEGAERQALIGMESILPNVEQICVACHDFRSNLGHGERFRTRSFVENFLVEHGFVIRTRPDDPRDYVRDHVFGLRKDM